MILYFVSKNTNKTCKKIYYPAKNPNKNIKTHCKIHLIGDTRNKNTQKMKKIFATHATTHDISHYSFSFSSNSNCVFA
jgi:hypothetical protein